MLSTDGTNPFIISLTFGFDRIAKIIKVKLIIETRNIRIFSKILYVLFPTTIINIIPIKSGIILISTPRIIILILPINDSIPIEVPLILPDSYAEFPTKRERKINIMANHLRYLLFISVNISPRPFLVINPILELISCR